MKKAAMILCVFALAFLVSNTAQAGGNVHTEWDLPDPCMGC